MMRLEGFRVVALTAYNLRRRLAEKITACTATTRTALRATFKLLTPRSTQCRFDQFICIPAMMVRPCTGTPGISWYAVSVMFSTRT